MGREIYILGTDPGFASFGFGIVQLLPDRERVVRVDVIRTEKSSKKLNVKASDDNFRRGQAIAAVLDDVINEYQPVAVTAEAASWPRNAGATAKVAISWGIIITLCYKYRLPMAQATPMDIKKRLCDNKSATKEQVQTALELLYPDQFDDFKTRFPAKKPPKPNGQWEHGFDAVGSVVSCLDSDVLRMARGMSG